MNDSFKNIFKLNDAHASNFHVTPNNDNIIEQFLDLQLLYDFVQKTLALKIYPGENIFNNQIVDISLFKNLKLLEIHRFSCNVLIGLKNLRSQIEYLICIRSAKNLKDILEYCGGDKVQGFLWNELKEAVFCHNSIDNLDTSLEFLPQLSSIDLSHNCIRNVHYINCLSNLRYLNLSFNRIECIPVFNRQLCNTLQVLLLRNNYIDDIKELSTLVNLCELDLSNNCLIEHNQLLAIKHNQLLAISNLENLQRLMLVGNPLSYHPKHRRKTVMYMHIKSPKAFLLDNTYLSSLELRAIGTISPMLNGFDRSSSMNSITTINTVVPVCNQTTHTYAAESTSDMEVSDGSSLSNNQSDVLNENSWSSSHARDSEGIIMQDSGFVAEPRRLSSSICSIGSASSLNSKVETIRNCESDIEVLSNPSQSSIEVISSKSMPRYVQSSSAIQIPVVKEVTSTKADLLEAQDKSRNSL
ncbi:Leucine rich repeat [Popillia japonica]|uniref:Leucine rich repeat n=1 Tax=Popillia japonica TaxID=7064 RepID=A0AAW1ITL0_POPJA